MLVESRVPEKPDSCDAMKKITYFKPQNGQAMAQLAINVPEDFGCSASFIVAFDSPRTQLKMPNANEISKVQALDLDLSSGFKFKFC